MSYNQQNVGEYSTIRDLNESRRYAVSALSDVVRLHQLGDKDDEEWTTAKAQLHHATIQYYLQLKPYLLNEGILYDPQDSIVFETDDGYFQIHKLDDFVLSSTEEEQEIDRVGEPNEVEVKEVPHQLPIEVSKECIDYLNSKLVQLGLTVQAQKQESPKNIEKPEVANGDNNDGEES